MESFAAKTRSFPRRILRDRRAAVADAGDRPTLTEWDSRRSVCATTPTRSRRFETVAQFDAGQRVKPEVGERALDIDVTAARMPQDGRRVHAHQFHQLTVLLRRGAVFAAARPGPPTGLSRARHVCADPSQNRCRAKPYVGNSTRRPPRPSNAAGQSTATPAVNSLPAAVSSDSTSGPSLARVATATACSVGQRLLHRRGQTAQRDPPRQKPLAPSDSANRTPSKTAPAGAHAQPNTAPTRSRRRPAAQSRWTPSQSAARRRLMSATTTGELVDHRLHQRRMKRMRHRQPMHPPAPAAPTGPPGHPPRPQHPKSPPSWGH